MNWHKGRGQCVKMQELKRLADYDEEEIIKKIHLVLSSMSGIIKIILKLLKHALLCTSSAENEEAIVKLERKTFFTKGSE
ncbi:CLUMA_CG014605, isoform A [Clunio marinus]|uniref:CLUMA_CG014605, isoform A n=1 Tax=Clunio marinus TaxID=568069 RepID=A0A1J1IS52_9DIPT|nr:CLUMA_CG014605, isoform A [Clunio marinus]